MRHYETVFIINPDLSEEDTTATVEKFSGILAAGGVAMGKVDLWGRRRMAYEVKKFGKGFYVLFDYGASPEAVAEMERNFKIDERVIRFLTIKKADIYDPEAIARAEAEAAARVAQAAAEEEKRAVSGRDDEESDYDYEDEDES
jgi:small subunit ribosomal protein S6